MFETGCDDFSKTMKMLLFNENNGDLMLQATASSLA